MDCISTFFQFILLISEELSHLDVYARYHFVRLLWFHRPIQKRPATVFQLKPSWISLSGYLLCTSNSFVCYRVKSVPIDVVHYDIWWSCCKPQIPIFCKISWQKLLVVQLHADPSICRVCTPIKLSSTSEAVFHPWLAQWHPNCLHWFAFLRLNFPTLA